MRPEDLRPGGDLFEGSERASPAGREGLPADEDATVPLGPGSGSRSHGRFNQDDVLDGRFRILRPLGAGGMGEVYLAIDERLQRQVAVKTLPASLSADEDARHRLEREAHSICSLNHPRICTLYDIGWSEDLPYLVMELLPGETLAERLRRGPLPLPEALRVADGIAEALAYAHRSGIVHRDLKPGNIMLTEHGPKLLDFGVAKHPVAFAGGSESTVWMTAPGVIVGSVAYMSPEQASGRPVDRRSDVFSFGSVVHEMVSGRRAFEGRTAADALGAVMERDPKALRTLVPAAPPGLERIVSRCLRKDRDARYPDMDAVRHDLLAIRGRPSRKPWMIAAAALLVIATAALLMRLPSGGQHTAVLAEPVQITADLAHTTDPSVSRDGRRIAFVSDREDPGKSFSVYVQPLDGTESRGLASCGVAGDPVFTPDGARVIYSCGPTLREQSIYSVPVEQGPATLVVGNASFPSLSPDGSRLAYLALPDQRWMVQSLNGGSPTALEHPNPAAPSKAVWSPDGTRLLFLMPAGERAFVAPLDGTPAAVLSLVEMLNNASAASRGLASEPHLYSWAERYLYLSMQSAGGSRDVWRVLIDARGKLLGDPVRVTAGLNAWSGDVRDQTVFATSGGSRSNLYAVPLSPDGRSATGPARQLTSDAALSLYPQFAEAAPRLGYISLRNAKPHLFVIDVARGRSYFVAQLPAETTEWGGGVGAAAIAPDGTQVVWAENHLRDIYSSLVEEPAKVNICRGCGYPLAWLPGHILVVKDPSDPSTLYSYDLSSRERSALLTAPRRTLQFNGISPDGQWIAFQNVDMEQRAELPASFIAHRDRTQQEDWVPVLREFGVLANPAWSAGDMLYAANGQEVRAVVLQPLSKFPVGPAFTVYRPEPPLRVLHVAVTRGMLVVSLERWVSNVWMQRLPE